MFDFSFSFAGALWALPLAAAPILLHLLFRQKSPIVQFSTLRFIKLSVQRTAARKRVQKWLLLACRTLLLALLIWAIAQPVHRLASGWLGGGKTGVAAIVVDTSYSMQLQSGNETMAARADAAVQDLLRDQLGGAKVAIFNSASSRDHPETLQDTSALLSQWVPLQSTPSTTKLVDRVTAAVDLLDRQPAQQKWLVVISDFQGREFPHELPQPKDGKTILLDLHPPEVRNAGVTKISLSPAQPIPGIATEAVIDLTGQPADARAVMLKSMTIDGNPLSQTTPAMATLDGAGHATLRFPTKLSADRWQLLTANLTADDAMAWDNQRTQLIEVPPKQSVGVLQSIPPLPAERFVRLALDPNEGKISEWPITVKQEATPGTQDDVTVAVLAKWPDANTAAALQRSAEAGRVVILMLAPGLEETWLTLPKDEQASLVELLPSAPQRAGGTALRRAAIGDPREPLLSGLTDDRYQLGAIVVRQMVPFRSEGAAVIVLSAVPPDPLPGVRPLGLLFRKPIGRGMCYTLATVPDPRCTNLATHPTFLPLLVRMALKPADQTATRNVELGEPLRVDAARLTGVKELQVEGPKGEQYRVPLATSGQFVFESATEPGIYRWRDVASNQIVAVTNVQLPAAESDLTYRAAGTVAPPGPDLLTANSIADLKTKIDGLVQPQPQWAMPIAIVMFLLCLEALLGSWSNLRKAPTVSGFPAKMPMPATV